MPIRADLKHLYRNPEWAAIRQRIIVDRAKYRCEHCDREKGQPYVGYRGAWVSVVLTVSHLDHNPANNEESNLASLCAACHLKHDRKQHAENARSSRQYHKDAARPLLGEVNDAARI